MSLSERILGIGRRRESPHPKGIATTIQGLQHLASPVLSGRATSEYLFTESDGATVYATLDQNGNRTGQRLTTEQFLEVAYGYLDKNLGRNPEEFHFFLEETIGANIVRTAIHPSRVFPGISITAKHVFVVNVDGSETRTYVQWYVQREHLNPNRRFIRLPR